MSDIVMQLFGPCNYSELFDEFSSEALTSGEKAKKNIVIKVL